MKTLITATAAASMLLAAAAAPAGAQARRAAAQPASRAATPAAAPAAAPAGPPMTWGPPIQGVCVFSFDRAVGRSAAGKAAGDRIRQLTAQVQAELQPEQTSIQTDAKAFEAQRATLPADQVQTRGQALQARANAFEQKGQLRQAELRATLDKARQRIATEVDPIVRSVAQAKACSVLLNGDSLLGANPSMDLDDAVVSQLNAKMPTITFDREHIDPQQLTGGR